MPKKLKALEGFKPTLKEKKRFFFFHVHVYDFDICRRTFQFLLIKMPKCYAGLLCLKLKPRFSTINVIGVTDVTVDLRNADCAQTHRMVPPLIYSKTR